MNQTPGHISSHQLIQSRLPVLTTREKIEILFKATHPLGTKEKGEVLRAAGIQFLKHQVPHLALKLLIEHYVKGILWSAIYIVAAVACVFLLALLQAPGSAFLTTLATLVAFFLGFLLFALFDFLHMLRTLFTRKLSKEERARLVSAIEALEPPERSALLKRMGAQVFRRELGDTIFGSLLKGIAISLVGGLLTGLFLLLSVWLAHTFATLYLPIVAAGVAFLAGFFLPRYVHEWLEKLSRRRTPATTL